MSPLTTISLLTDPQWDALRPHLAHAAPWQGVPSQVGHAGTVARHFRRLTGAGLWERLLQALADLGPRHPLQALRRVIFRAARRAYRIRGLGIIVLARRLGFPRALPAPPG